jgi:hypothetical protein
VLCLPLRTPLIVNARPMPDRLRGFLKRDLIEQNATERLARAALLAGVRWLAICWALS